MASGQVLRGGAARCPAGAGPREGSREGREGSRERRAGREPSYRPLDPRLLRHARPAAIHIGVLVALGAGAAVLIIIQARLLAGAITGAFPGSAPRGALTGTLVALAVVFALRALLAWATEASSYRASAAVKQALRRSLLAHALALGPRWLAGKRTGELAALATTGIDSLDSYFAAYLPQFVLAMVIPLVVVAQIASADVLAGVTIVLTLPLIPLFGALAGRATAQHTRRRWRALGLLSHHFLDVVAGLPTLKVFGRAKAQAETIRKVTGDYRRATMGTLRLAFLSSLVLELTATLSVALVAVGIGLRLVYGHLDLRTGLFVLILAPEAYLPLRQAAAQFHASADGLAAVAEVFGVLDTPVHQAGAAAATAAATAQAPGATAAGADRAAAGGPLAVADLVAVRVEGVSVCHPGRAEPAPQQARLTVCRGEIVAVTGPSGGGKSTLLATLLGFAAVSEGRIIVQQSSGEADLAAIGLDAWRSRVAWVPQDPILFNGTVAANIRLGWPDAPHGHVAAAAAAAALDDVALAAPVGERGGGLSAGQRRRVALARALLPGPGGRARPLLLLDEPTAGLDPATETRVLATLRGLAAAGRAVLVVTHKPAALAAADRVVTIGRGTRPAAGGDLASPVPAGPGLAGPGLAGPGLASPVPAGPDLVSPDLASAVPVPAGPAGGNDLVHRDDAGVRAPASEVRLRGQRHARWRLALAAFAGTCAAGCAIGLTGTAAWLISRAAQHPPVFVLMVAITAVRAFGIGRGCFRYIERLAGHDAALRFLAGLRVAAYRRLERLAPAGLAAFRSGDLVTRLVADIDGLADRWLRVLLPYLVAGAAGAAAVAVMAALLPAAGVVVAVSLVAAALLAPWLASLVARRAERQVTPRRGALAAVSLDLLRGAGEIAAFGAQQAALGQVSAAGLDVSRSESRSGLGRGTGAAVAALAAGAAVWGCLYLGAGAVRSGALPGAALAVVVLVPLAAHEVFSGLAPAAQQLPRIRSAAARVSGVLSAPEPVREVAADTADMTGGAGAGPAARPGPPYDIRIDGLTARWRRDGPDVLRGISLEVPAGRRVAITGPSGSGKTTLAMVLLRFLDPAAGSVTLGGTDITALPGDTVRTIIGLCAQDAHIFDSTLAENLRLARPGAGDAELRDALRRARLLDWADSLPDGLDTLVGEFGARLSGGQRQRLALARVLLADFPVVVLDEPTEHLDEPAATALTRDLLEQTRGRTVLLITHRTSQLAGVDEVVCLGHGATGHASDRAGVFAA